MAEAVEVEMDWEVVEVGMDWEATEMAKMVLEEWEAGWQEVATEDSVMPEGMVVVVKLGKGMEGVHPKVLRAEREGHSETLYVTHPESIQVQQLCTQPRQDKLCTNTLSYPCVCGVWVSPLHISGPTFYSHYASWSYIKRFRSSLMDDLTGILFFSRCWRHWGPTLY